MTTESPWVELGDEDFAVLFPQQSFMLGKQEIILKPLCLEDSAHLMAAIKADLPALMADLAEQGVNLDNLQDNLGAIGEIIIHRVPLVISILTGVHPDSVSKLPVVVALDLFKHVVEINLKDQDFFGLLSSIKDAADNFNRMMHGGALAKDSQKQSRGSSPRGTRGKPFKRTRGAK